MAFRIHIVLLLFWLCPQMGFAKPKTETIMSQDWSICEAEMVDKKWPRTCLVLGVHTQKLGYPKLHQKVEEHCLRYIERWLPLEPADSLILETYYPRCHYRFISLLMPQRLDLDMKNERRNLVRFLYMKATHEHQNPDTKRLQNSLKARPRP